MPTIDIPLNPAKKRKPSTKTSTKKAAAPAKQTGAKKEKAKSTVSVTKTTEASSKKKPAVTSTKAKAAAKPAGKATGKAKTASKKATGKRVGKPAGEPAIVKAKAPKAADAVVRGPKKSLKKAAAKKPAAASAGRKRKRVADDDDDAAAAGGKSKTKKSTKKKSVNGAAAAEKKSTKKKSTTKKPAAKKAKAPTLAEKYAKVMLTVPKKANTAWMFFAQDEHKRVHKPNGVSLMDACAISKVKWRQICNVDENKKPLGPPTAAYAKWKELERLDQIRCAQEEAAMSDVQKKAKKFTAKLRKREKKAIEEPKRAAGKPKRPITAYMAFVKKMGADVKEHHPNASFHDMGKLLGTYWHKLTPAERAPFDAVEAKNRKVFHQKLEAYYTKFPNERPKDKNASAAGVKLLNC